MLATLEKVENGYLAQFERNIEHSVKEVWPMLTENEKLAKWFPELQVVDLHKGGHIQFDMQNGTYEKMDILDFKRFAILEYTWAKDIVRFELSGGEEGCQLVLKEKIHKLTEHTPKDLAGWHVCLDVIEAILDGRLIESRKELWEEWYEKYVQAIEKIR